MRDLCTFWRSHNQEHANMSQQSFIAQNKLFFISNRSDRVITSNLLTTIKDRLTKIDSDGSEQIERRFINWPTHKHKMGSWTEKDSENSYQIASNYLIIIIILMLCSRFTLEVLCFVSRSLTRFCKRYFIGPKRSTGVITGNASALQAAQSFVWWWWIL